MHTCLRYYLSRHHENRQGELGPWLHNRINPRSAPAGKVVPRCRLPRIRRNELQTSSDRDDRDDNNGRANCHCGIATLWVTLGTSVSQSGSIAVRTHSTDWRGTETRGDTDVEGRNKSQGRQNLDVFCSTLNASSPQHTFLCA